jgi:hypothetical protein
MVFYTCAICEVEHGLALMVKIEDAKDRIASSGIKNLYQRMIAPLTDPESNRYEKAFAQAASDEMEDGLLIGATHICRQCNTEVSPKIHRGAGPTNDHAATSEENGRVPKRALVNGFFRGKVPPELACLNRTEVSLVTIINVQTTLVMLPQRCHYGSRATAFSVMNDLAEVAEKLPRNPGVEQIAIIRTQNSSSPKDYRYNPRKVLSALAWLVRNNHLYASVLSLPVLPDGTPDPSWADGGMDLDLEPPYIPAEDSDYEGVDQPGVAASGQDGHPVNPGAPASDTTDVYLQGAPETPSLVQQLAAVVGSKTQPTVVLVRNRGEFVSDYDTEQFLAKAYPQIFPYGRGCPNIIGPVAFNGAYIQHTLHLGRYRSFQRCASYIFYAYTWWIRKRIGTVSFLVDRAGGEDDAVLTVADAQNFLRALSAEPGLRVQSYMESQRIRRLLERMQPYANELPGTELYFARERKKLMSMISSPVTTTEGQWAWFFTEAQPDLYAAEIYDNAVSSAGELTNLHWNAPMQERQACSDKLTALQRSSVLRDHPFMSARIHSLQQAAFWSCVLCGEDKPLGEIMDFWCRVEFQMKGTPHWHCLINISKKSLQGIHADSVLSNEYAEQQKVKDLVARVSTAMLLPRDPQDNHELVDMETRVQTRLNEKKWEYNIDRPRYMNDATHPSRHRFHNLGRDYYMLWSDTASD